jgi:hypothetical protein
MYYFTIKKIFNNLQKILICAIKILFLVIIFYASVITMFEEHRPSGIGKRFFSLDKAASHKKWQGTVSSLIPACR